MQVQTNQCKHSFAFRICSCCSLCLEFSPTPNFTILDEHLSGFGLNFTFSTQLPLPARLSVRVPSYWLPQYCLTAPSPHFIVICLLYFLSHQAISSLRASIIPILFITVSLAPRHCLVPSQSLKYVFVAGVGK